MAYDNTNTGALFKNDKQGNDNWPDYRGQINIEGTDYWISAWLKTSKKDNSRYMSLSVQPMQKKQSSGKQNQQQGRQRRPEPPQDDFADSEIPF